MLNQVIHTIKNKDMIKAGDNVICALSGGADSMALLYALYTIREKIPFTLYAAHLHHGIRGAEADGDCLFVEKECEKLGVKLFVKKVDVPKIAKEKGIGEEECGRWERYNFFTEVLDKLGGGVVATGHHMNDRAETVLFNLFRGSGGLKGIPYKRDYIIRPLMDVKRQDTEDYLKKLGVSWREDSTNKMNKYSRNSIRNTVLKDIEKNFPKAVEKICDSENINQIDNEYLNLLAKDSGSVKDGAILVDKFLSLHESIRRRVIMLALSSWGVEKNLETIKAVYETLLGQSGNGRDLPQGKRVVKEYNFVLLKETENQLKTENEQTVKIGENLEIPTLQGVWSVKTVDKTEKMRDNKMMIILDSDKLGEAVSVRKRKDGDYMYPKGLGGRKKIKEIFIDMKIPREQRDCISLIAVGAEVLFIPGVKKTGNYLPDENTTKFFVAEFKPI